MLPVALGRSASISPTTAIDASFSSLNSFSDRVAVSIDSVNFCSTGTSGSFPIASYTPESLDCSHVAERERFAGALKPSLLDLSAERRRERRRPLQRASVASAASAFLRSSGVQ